MSETREIFTQRRKGVSQKEVRIKQHNEERKGKRHDLLLKRRIPNDTESDEEPEGIGKSTVAEGAEASKTTAWEKSEQRRLQLLEWQAKRKTVKMEAAKAKKAFVVGSKQPVLNIVALPGTTLAPAATNVEKLDATTGPSSGPTKSSTGSNAQQATAAKRVTRSQRAVCGRPTDVQAPPPKSSKASTTSDRKAVVAKPKGHIAEQVSVPKRKQTAGKEDPGTAEKVCDVEKTVSDPAREKAKGTVEKKGGVVEKKVLGVSEKKGGVVEKKGSVTQKKEVNKKEGVVEKKSGAAESKQSTVERKGKPPAKKPAATGATRVEKPTSKVPDKGRLRKSQKEPAMTVESTPPPMASPDELCNSSTDGVNAKLEPLGSLATEVAPLVTSSIQDENQPPDLPWVPAVSQPTQGTSKAPPSNFSEVFGGSPLHSFSPFRFTGARTPRAPRDHGEYKFTFHKSLPADPKDFVADMVNESSGNMELDSLMEPESAGGECGDGVGDEKITSAGGDCIGGVHQMECVEGGSKVECGGGDLKKDGSDKETGDNNQDDKRCSNEERSDYDLKGDGVNDGGRQVEGERNDCKGDNSQPQEKEGDIASFRKLHSNVVEKLTSLCEQWEERPTTSTIPEGIKEEGEAISLHSLLLGGWSTVQIFVLHVNVYKCCLLLLTLNLSS